MTVLPSRQGRPSPPASRPSTEKPSAPVIVTISLPSIPLPATGGSANVTVTTRGATDCQLTPVNHPILATDFDQQRLFVLDGGSTEPGSRLGPIALMSSFVRSSSSEPDGTLGRRTHSHHRRRTGRERLRPTPTASLTLNEASLPPTGGTISTEVLVEERIQLFSWGPVPPSGMAGTRRRSPATEATSRRFPRPRQRGSGRSPSPLPAPLASQCPSPVP